jgi:hypothetical protein
VCEDRGEKERYDAIDCQQGRRKRLGLGRVEVQSRFEHVREDGDDEAKEERFCAG